LRQRIKSQNSGKTRHALHAPPGAPKLINTMDAQSPSVTELLAQARGGNVGARDAAYELVYAELKRLAHRELARQRGATLCTTALVHEAYVRLSGSDADPTDRSHLIALGARAMRFVLVDHARRAAAKKREGAAQALSITSAQDSAEPGVAASDVLALDQALERLNGLDARLAQVVEWRFFGGLSEPEIAAELGVTERTVQRDWRRARAFLYRELAETATL
jgi:RNA polymerase sigma factor (TIGR02999 family)